jgi:mono/diheme cytochrome c family protein
MRKRVAMVVIPGMTFALMLASELAVGRPYASALQAAAGAQATDTKAAPSVWDSVYSITQADAGKLVYQESCSGCHGTDLSGGHARSLRGDVFLRDWSADSLDRLYKRMKTLMPQNAPASLRDEDYLNVVAYILQVNEFPAGTKALTADQITQIQVYGKGGPSFVPDFALVGVVACLTQAPNNTWVLASGSSPVMTRNPNASTGDELQKVADMPLGTQTYQVVDAVPEPDPNSKDHKVEAKGFLMSKPQRGISITSLQTVAATCGK